MLIDIEIFIDSYNSMLVVYMLLSITPLDIVLSKIGFRLISLSMALLRRGTKKAEVSMFTKY